MAAPTTLAVVETPYRGAVETQYADVFYLLRELNRQLGGLHVLLRGLAATCAVCRSGPAPRLDGPLAAVDTLPDPASAVAALVDEGASVFVEEPDRVAFGLSDASCVDGVQPVAAGVLLSRTDYEAVWFV